MVWCALPLFFFFSTGRWASGTPLVNTQGKAFRTMSIYIKTNYVPTPTGSTNVDCIGLVSSSGNSTIIQQAADAARATASAHKRRQSIIIGVSVTLGFLVLLGISVAAFFWMRRRQRHKQEEEAILSPTQFVEVERTPGQVSSDPDSSRLSGKAALAAAAAGAAQSTSSAPQGSTAPGSSPSNSDPIPNSPTRTHTNADSQSSSGFTTFPTTSIRRNPKAAEGGYTVQSSGSDTAVSPVDEEGDVVFQHRDGGHVVRELPPPYLDRPGPSPPS